MEVFGQVAQLQDSASSCFTHTRLLLDYGLLGCNLFRTLTSVICRGEVGHCNLGKYMMSTSLVHLSLQSSDCIARALLIFTTKKVGEAKGYSAGGYS